MHSDANPEVFELANKLRRKRTKEEIKLWEYLKSKPLGFKFRQQHPFGLYILDFYCHQAQLFIEVDGQSHLHKVQRARDDCRTKFVNEMGVEELRFTNDQVNTNFIQVCKNIESFLKSKSHPSPKG